MKDKKISYKKYYGRPYKRVYGRKHGMDNNTFKILWTALWLVFIGGMCVLFNSAIPFAMLGIWFIGML